MKMNFEYFQIQIGILQTVRMEKVDEKNVVICRVSMFPSWVMVLKLSKKEHVLQFCARLRKKSESIKAIYIYLSERSRYALSRNGIDYYARTYCFEDIRIWSRRMLLNFCWVSIFFFFFFGYLNGWYLVNVFNDIKVRVFFGKNVEKKHLCCHDKNYYYFWKSIIPVINLIAHSRNMIKVSKKFCFWMGQNFGKCNGQIGSEM